MSDFLNFVDEILDGTPKYNITDNLDGTKNIELANEIVQEGTALNRAILNKINSIMGYNNVTGFWNPTTSTAEFTITNFDVSNYINDERVLLHCINSGILTSDWDIYSQISDKNSYQNNSIIKKLKNGNILVADCDTTRTYQGAVSIYDTDFTLLYRKYCNKYSVWTNALELNDGNIVFVENDNSTLSFYILSPTLEVIVNKTSLGTYSDLRPQIIQLDNNNIMILDYRNNQSNSYPIYVSIISPTGTIIKSITQISLYGYGLKTQKLKNGNIVIFGGCNGTNNGTIAILDPTGTILYQNYINYVTYSALTELDNENICVVYFEWQTSKTKFAIYDNTLNLVVEPIDIEHKTPKQLLQMNNNNILYLSENNNNAYITIYDINGNVIKNETQISNANGLKNANAIQLKTTSIFIIGTGSWIDGVIIDNNGNILKSQSVIANSGGSYYPSCVQLDNNNIAIVSNTNSSAGSNKTYGLILKPKGNSGNVTLNNIQIDTLLEDNKYYELVYNEALNKFIAEEVRNAN